MTKIFPQGKISLISLHLSSLVPEGAAQRPEWLFYCPVYKVLIVIVTVVIVTNITIVITNITIIIAL